MEELKPSTKEPESASPKCCPVCGVQTLYAYAIHETQTGIAATWYRCQCGIVFQENPPVGDCYDEKYAADYGQMKEGDVRQVHAARIYSPIIEETTYGRFMLDVGYATGRVMSFFEERGWIPFGIDVNKSIGGNGNLYTGDFTNYDFTIPIKNKDLEALAGDEGKIERKFDLIWMSHVLEHFNDPLAALRKAESLLLDTGVLFIAVPDADFINKVGVPGYPHWKAKEHYTLWTEQALRREVERLGLKVILSRRNFSSRFQSWYDVQLIAQKNYF